LASCGTFCRWFRPDTLLHWRPDLLIRRHAATCGPKRRGYPPTIRSIRVLVSRLTRENASWGYRRIHSKLTALDITVAASTVWKIRNENSIPPTPERQSTARADLLRSQAEALLACDLFDVRPSRSSSIPPGESGSWAQPHPTAKWIV
jgi:hypothetical protein